MLHRKLSHLTETLRELDLNAPDARQKLDMAVLNLNGIAESVECLEANFVPADKEAPNVAA